MNKRVLSRNPDCEQRSGFTWVELLAVIVILGLLLALLLPSVRSAKETALRTQCLNHLRNVGIAIQGYTVSNHGNVPALSGGTLLSDPRPSQQPGKLVPAPWTVELLPYIEQNMLHDTLSQSNNGSQAHAEIVDRAAKQSIEIFICPSDKRASIGRLSYVANVGLIPEFALQRPESSSLISSKRFDMGFNGYGPACLNAEDFEVAQGLGVFRAVDTAAGGVGGNSDRLNLDQVSKYDGTANTVLLSENLNTRSYDPTSNSPGFGGWLSNDIGDIAFGICVPMLQSNDGTVWQVPLNSAPGGVGIAGGDKTQALAPGRDPVPIESRINSNLKTARNGEAPRPSSNHYRTVNMAFADGSCKVISDDIAPGVYARLLTPMGGEYGQGPLSDVDF